MTVTFTCPHCGTTTEVADEYVGQTGPCASCGNKITVPIPEHAGKPGPVSKSSTGSVILVTVLGGFAAFLLCGGVLAALLLPAVQSAREAARRMQCSNNLKQIALAMHNYHDAYGSFPPAYTVNEDGEKMHSWRTMLLPFLEQSPLYSQVNFDEPWDSPSNRSIADTILPVFQCPSDPDMSLNYMAVVGDATAFQGSEPVKIQDILDGTSNTIMVVEVHSKGTSWMEPTDLDYDTLSMSISQQGGGFGSLHPGGAQVAFCDGSVRFLSESIAPALLQGLLTKDGGEIVGGF